MRQSTRTVCHFARGALKSISWAFTVVSLGTLVAIWLDWHHVHGVPALIDNLAAGVAAGCIVFYYEYRRRRHIERRLETVRMMNHHVRNDLQVIMYGASPDVLTDPPAAVQAAIRHIEWALREVLPGDMHTRCVAPVVPSTAEMPDVPADAQAQLRVNERKMFWRS